MPPANKRAPKPEALASLIFMLRGEKVLLTEHLSDLYGVSPKALNQAVKRNRARFPEDFMFQLTRAEANGLLASRSQTVTLKRGQNVKYLSYAFTEQGVAMLSSEILSLASWHSVVVRVDQGIQEIARKS